jgi:hypothetical protein
VSGIAEAAAATAAAWAVAAGIATLAGDMPLAAAATAFCAAAIIGLLIADAIGRNRDVR